MITIVALNHNYRNLERFSRIFGETLPNNIFFTMYPEGGQDHPVARPDGIMEGFTAQNINHLKKGAYG
jgi:hypothetical protein